MARIILTANNVVLHEMVLSKARLLIGRAPDNDIVIDDQAISAEHAAIVSMDGDAILEDRNSTNGTQVNGQPVRKHFLQDGDVVELAQYRIEYIAGQRSAAGGVDEKEVESSLACTARGKSVAVLQILNGPNVGKETRLVKPLTTLGCPGVQVAAIVRRAHDYYLMHIEGDGYPLVNGVPTEVNARCIVSGDVIDLMGTQMRFLMG